MRALLVGVLCLLEAPSAAHAYFVDISITGAGRVYETTDANELDDHCPDAIEGFASPSTTPTGTLGASFRAGDASGDYGWGWVVRYEAEPAAGYRFDGWHSDGRTTPGPVHCDGSGGSPDYSGVGCQFATHADLQVRQVRRRHGPRDVLLDGTQPARQRGTYTLQVRAVDWSGNMSTESTWTWTVDKAPPSTEPGSFQCKLDGPGGPGSFGACDSTPDYAGLADGTYTFSARALDDLSNVGPAVTRT